MKLENLYSLILLCAGLCLLLSSQPSCAAYEWKKSTTKKGCIFVHWTDHEDTHIFDWDGSCTPGQLISDGKRSTLTVMYSDGEVQIKVVGQILNGLMIGTWQYRGRPVQFDRGCMRNNGGYDFGCDPDSAPNAPAAPAAGQNAGAVEQGQSAQPNQKQTGAGSGGCQVNYGDAIARYNAAQHRTEKDFFLQRGYALGGHDELLEIARAQCPGDPEIQKMEIERRRIQAICDHMATPVDRPCKHMKPEAVGGVQTWHCRGVNSCDAIQTGNVTAANGNSSSPPVAAAAGGKPGAQIAGQSTGAAGMPSERATAAGVDPQALRDCIEKNRIEGASQFGSNGAECLSKPKKADGNKPLSKDEQLAREHQAKAEADGALIKKQQDAWKEKQRAAAEREAARQRGETLPGNSSSAKGAGARGAANDDGGWSTTVQPGSGASQQTATAGGAAGGGYGGPAQGCQVDTSASDAKQAQANREYSGSAVKLSQAFLAYLDEVMNAIQQQCPSDPAWQAKYGQLQETSRSTQKSCDAISTMPPCQHVW